MFVIYVNFSNRQSRADVSSICAYKRITLSSFWGINITVFWINMLKLAKWHFIVPYMHVKSYYCMWHCASVGWNVHVLEISAVYNIRAWAGSSVGIATEIRVGRFGIESWWGRNFPPVQTGPGAHPASCKMSTGSFPGVLCGRDVLLTTRPHLVPRSWKSRAIPLPTLWGTRTCNGITLPYIIKAIGCLLHLRYTVSETPAIMAAYRRCHHPKAGSTLILHLSEGWNVL